MPFRRSLPLLLALSFPLAAAAPLIAADAPPPAAHNDHEQHGGQTLGHAMENMGHAMKQLAGQLSDKSKNASSLELLSKIEDALVIAKQAEPPLTNEQPAAQRPAYVANYRIELIEVMQDVLNMETDLIKGDNVKAADYLPKLRALMEKGHHEYRPKRGRD